jgi:molybdopterin converting factor small subunit
VTGVATVHLPSGLAKLTGGTDAIAIDAPRVAELLAELRRQFPRLAHELDEMAVAVDGEIYSDPGYQPLRPDSEVHLVPRIAGGGTRP